MDTLQGLRAALAQSGSSFVRAWEAGGEAARENQKRKALADYLQPAAQGDQGALAGLYRAGAANEAMQAQNLSLRQREADLGDFGKVSSAFAQTGDPSLYRAWRAGAVKLGLPADMPETLTSPEDLSGARQAAMAFAKAYGAKHDSEQFTLAPGSKRFDASGKVVAEVPSSPASLQTIQTSDGYSIFDPRTGEVRPLSYGNAPEASPQPVRPSAGSSELDDIQRRLSMLNVPGARMTSGARTPQHNAEVGGKPNSQHLYGTAADFTVPDQGKADFIAQARRNGFQVIDEGDHLHVQVPKAGGPDRVMPPSKNPQGMVRKLTPDEIAAAGYRLGSVVERNEMTGEDRIVQAPASESGSGKPSATQIKLANTAKQKLVDLQTMQQQLHKVDEAYSRLKGTYSAGLGGNLLPTEDGRRFDAAVALLKGQVRKLTRTPGEGAMSDYESKLAELANPSRGEYEQVTADQLDQLRSLVQTTRQGYEALLQDAGGSSANLTQPGGASAPALPTGFSWEN